MAIWIQTHLGRALSLPDFGGDVISHHETGHVLANLCRFGGRTRTFYSVAQHSMLVARRVRNSGGPLAAVWQALNHEGDESLLGFDPPSPLLEVCPDLRRLKKRAHEVYCARYDLPTEFDPIVKHADLVLLATEKRDLMEPEPRPWRRLPEPMTEVIDPWSSEVAEEIFLGEWEKIAREIGFPESRW